MAKPKLALIPSTVGGSVYSVLPSNGDGDFNFTRTSAATRINAQGLIETVAVGDNRLNYPLLDGTVQTCPHLLLEGQRTNLLTYSEDFSNAYWTKTGSSVVSGFTSPDGTANAFKLVEDTSTVHSIYKLSVASPSQSKQSFSIFVKDSGDGRFVRITTNDGVNGWNYYFNPITGQEVSSTFATSKIISLPNGWYRIELMADGANYVTFGSVPFIVYLSDNGTSSTYTGDGTSGVYIFGAQVEEASYPTSYIVSNSGSATTRLAEVCDGSGNASTFNDSEGVLFAQIGALADDLTQRHIAISDGSTINAVRIHYHTTSNSIRGQIRAGGSVEASLTHIVPDIKDFHKVAISYKENDVKLYVDGVLLLTDTSASMPTGLDELAFDNGDSLHPFYGKTKQIQYFDSALTDSELETLTSWMSFSDMAIDLNYTIQ
jgi:hypothetical protein